MGHVPRTTNFGCGSWPHCPARQSLTIPAPGDRRNPVSPNSCGIPPRSFPCTRRQLSPFLALPRPSAILQPSNLPHHGCVYRVESWPSEAFRIHRSCLTAVPRCTGEALLATVRYEHDRRRLALIVPRLRTAAVLALASRNTLLELLTSVAMHPVSPTMWRRRGLAFLLGRTTTVAQAVSQPAYRRRLARESLEALH